MGKDIDIVIASRRNYVDTLEIERKDGVDWWKNQRLKTSWHSPFNCNLDPNAVMECLFSIVDTRKGWLYRCHWQRSGLLCRRRWHQWEIPQRGRWQQWSPLNSKSVTTSVADTGEEFLTSANDTGNLCLAGVDDTHKAPRLLNKSTNIWKKSKSLLNTSIKIRRISLAKKK